MAAQTGTPVTTIIFPILAVAFAVAAPFIGFDGTQALAPHSLAISGVMIVIMLGAVFAAVHHADVIAHRTGEPYGTLVLTLAVTVIEVALIESMVLMPNSSPALARDTVFAVVMIVCNGLVGLCVLVGGLRHHEQEFQVSGTGVYLIVLGALSILTLVLPNYTLAAPGPYFSTAQLLFVSVITVVLYAAFLFSLYPMREALPKNPPLSFRPSEARAGIQCFWNQTGPRLSRFTLGRGDNHTIWVKPVSAVRTG